MKTLGTTLKDARKSMGLTLRQVEESTGISNAYLSQLENEKIKSPSANILYKLSSLYNVSLKILLNNAGIIEHKEKEETNEHSKFVETIAFSSEGMNENERDEVLKYLEFIKQRKK